MITEVICFSIFITTSIFLIISDYKHREIDRVLWIINLISISIYSDYKIVIAIILGFLLSWIMNKADIVYILLITAFCITYQLEIIYYIPCILYMIVVYIWLRKEEKIPFLVILLPLIIYIGGFQLWLTL